MTPGATRLLVLASAVLVAGPATARTPVPLVDYESQSILTASGKAPTLAQVREAATKAAVGAGWALAKVADDTYTATRVVKGKHTMVVKLVLWTDKYSVTYQHSENLKYGVQDGVRVIHPNYNVWVGELVSAIRLETSKL